MACRSGLWFDDLFRAITLPPEFGAGSVVNALVLVIVRSGSSRVESGFIGSLLCSRVFVRALPSRCVRGGLDAAWFCCVLLSLVHGAVRAHTCYLVAPTATCSLGMVLCYLHDVGFAYGCFVRLSHGLPRLRAPHDCLSHASFLVRFGGSTGASGIGRFHLCCNRMGSWLRVVHFSVGRCPGVVGGLVGGWRISSNARTDPPNRASPMVSGFVDS